MIIDKNEMKAEMEKCDYEDIIRILSCRLGDTGGRSSCKGCPLEGKDCRSEAKFFLGRISDNEVFFRWLKTLDIKTLDEIFNCKDEIYSLAANRKNKIITDAAIELSKQLEGFSTARKKEIVTELNSMINNKK